MSKFFYFTKLGEGYNESDIEKFSVFVMRSVSSTVDTQALAQGEVRILETPTETYSIEASLKGAKKNQTITYRTLTQASSPAESVELEKSKIVATLSDSGEIDQLAELSGLVARLKKSIEAKAKAEKTPEVYSFDEKSQRNYEVRVNKFIDLVKSFDVIEEDDEPVSIQSLLEDEDAENDPRITAIVRIAEMYFEGEINGTPYPVNHCGCMGNCGDFCDDEFDDDLEPEGQVPFDSQEPEVPAPVSETVCDDVSEEKLCEDTSAQ